MQIPLTQKKGEVMTATVHEAIEKHGYVLLENFPEQKIKQLLESLGTIFEQDAGLQHAVRYESGFDDFRYSKSLNEIGPHTEFPYYNPPPKIQVLFCHRPATCGGGQTFLCAIRKFVNTLDIHERILLLESIIDFSVNKDFKDLAKKTAHFPLLQDLDNGFIFRFSHNLLYYGDVNAKIVENGQVQLSDNIQEIVNRFLAYVEEEKTAFNIPENGLLLWNNHEVVHWRNSYKDKNRHLVRYLVQ